MVHKQPELDFHTTSTSGYVQWYGMIWTSWCLALTYWEVRVSAPLWNSVTCDLPNILQQIRWKKVQILKMKMNKFYCCKGGATYQVVSWKRAHGWSTLQVCQRGEWALFRLFTHLTTKEPPCHVYSDLKPLKQIIGHKITYNVITSGFEVESWWHTTLRTVRCDGEDTVARG